MSEFYSKAAVRRLERLDQSVEKAISETFATKPARRKLDALIRGMILNNPADSADEDRLVLETQPVRYR